MKKTIKFDYFANGRYAGTTEISSSVLQTSTDVQQAFIDCVVSKRPTLKNDEITVSVYEC